MVYNPQMGAWSWLLFVGLFFGRAAACVPCEFGREYEVAACVCAACTVCGEGEYEARGCEAERDTVCEMVATTTIRPTQTSTTAASRVAQRSTTAASRAAPASTPLPQDVDPALDYAVHVVLAVVCAGIGCAAVVAVGVAMFRPHRGGIVRGVLCEGKGAPRDSMKKTGDAELI